MDDLISRSELKMCIRDLAKTIARANGGVDDVTVALKEVYDMVGEAPTIDAEPVRHGRWIETNKPGWVNGQYYETPRLVCPFCAREAAHYSVEEAEQGGRVTTVFWLRTDCCPHCGAKMDGGDPNVCD